MSDTSSQLQTRSRRPKRVLAKSSDDNILGISWKEERELRRAIYVSLRDQHNSAPGQTWMMSKLRTRQSSRTTRFTASRRTNLPSRSYLLRGSRQRLSTLSTVSNPVSTTNTLRRAKLRATAKLNGFASPSLRPSSPELTTALSYGAAYMDVHGRQENLSQVTRASRRHGNYSNSSLSSAHATARLKNRSRPLLMNASRGETTPSRPPSSTLRLARNKKIVTSQSKSSSSSGKRTVDTVISRAIVTPKRSQSTRSIRSTSIKNRIAKKLVSAAANKVAGKVQTPEDAKLSTELSPRKVVVPSTVQLPSNETSPLLDVAPARRPPALVPAELCQDPNGQPVSVHDFIEFVCYHGTPCLSPRLAWFNEPRIKLSYSGDHYCNGRSVSRSTGDVYDTRVSKRCTARATPPEHCVPASISSPAALHKQNSGPLVDCPSSLHDSFRSPTADAMCVARTPPVSVAKKMASVHQLASFSPQVDLFDVLSRSAESTAGQISESNNGQTDHNSTNKLLMSGAEKIADASRVRQSCSGRTRRGKPT